MLERGLLPLEMPTRIGTMKLRITELMPATTLMLMPLNRISGICTAKSSPEKRSASRTQTLEPGRANASPGYRYALR
jgi:hypothetical protein